MDLSTYRKPTPAHRRDADLDRWARYAPDLIRHRQELIGIARTFHQLDHGHLGIRATKLQFHIEDRLMELARRADAKALRRLP